MSSLSKKPITDIIHPKEKKKRPKKSPKIRKKKRKSLRKKSKKIRKKMNCNQFGFFRVVSKAVIAFL